MSLKNRRLARKMAGKFVLILLRREGKIASNDREFQEFILLQKPGFLFNTAC